MRKILTAAAFAASLLFAAAAPAHAEATTESSGIAVADYTVFVDPPTGFVFVKLPQGWKFAGQVDEAAMARLPSGVVTALLKDDAGRTLAARGSSAAKTLR